MEFQSSRSGIQKKTQFKYLGSNQKILGFNVPVDNMLAMKVDQSSSQWCDILKIKGILHYYFVENELQINSPSTCIEHQLTVAERRSEKCLHPVSSLYSSPLAAYSRIR